MLSAGYAVLKSIADRAVKHPVAHITPVYEDPNPLRIVSERAWRGKKTLHRNIVGTMFEVLCIWKPITKGSLQANARRNTAW